MSSRGRSNRALIIIATIAILTVFKVAQTVLMPLVISIFLGLLLLPLVRYLSAHHLPQALASILAVAAVMLLFSLILLPLTTSISSLNEAWPSYSHRLNHMVESLLLLLENYGIPIEHHVLLAELDHSAIARVIGRGMLSMMNVATNMVLIFIITTFLLLESKRFTEKIRCAFTDSAEFINSLEEIGHDIQRYLFWKTLMSLATALCVFIFLSIVGLDFALLWAFLAFVLNFIPSVGSIIATIPPMLIAVVQFDSPVLNCSIVLLGLGIIQLSIGNVLDPRLVGQHLRMSPLVVFLSMFFWGWMWGPVGMLLAVPLMVCLKVILHHNRSLRNIARLMEA